MGHCEKCGCDAVQYLIKDERGYLYCRGCLADAAFEHDGDVMLVPHVVMKQDAAAIQPPNYRISSRGNAVNCDRCAMFSRAGDWCALYRTPVLPNWICDSYIPSWYFPDQDRIAADAKAFKGLSDLAVDLLVEKTALDLPLADEDAAWSFSAADGNKILGDPPDWARYYKAHFYRDDTRKDTKDGYKLPFAKMVNGRLTAFWHGVRAAYGAMQGARGGVQIPEAARSRVLSRIKSYYKRFDKDWPLQKGEGGEADFPVRLRYVIKAVDRARHSVSGPFLAPDEMDVQEDAITADEILKSTHLFMRGPRRINVMHSSQFDRLVGDAMVVECCVLKRDLDYYGTGEVLKAGTALMDVEMEEGPLWDLIVSGELNGFSIEGTASSDE